MSDKQKSETKGRRLFHEPAKEVEGQRLQWQAEDEPSETGEASEEPTGGSEVEGQASSYRF